MTRRISLASAVALSLLLAACGAATSHSTSTAASAQASQVAPSGLDQLVAAAKQEGTVVVYGPPGAEYRPVLIDAFEKAYPGIHVEAVFAGSPERVSRLTTERAAGKYLADLLVDGTTSEVTDMKESKTIVDLEPQLVMPEVTNQDNWLQHQLWWADGSKPNTTLMFQGGVNNIVYYNTKMVQPTEFKSYWDLTDPKWKGKIIATDIRNPGPGGVPSRFLYKNPDVGPAWFQKFFGESGVTLGTDQRTMIDAIANGQYALGAFLSDTDVDTAASQGLPIGTIRAEQFKEGASMGPGYGAVVMVDRAPHPNAAKLYINWLLSKAGQMAWQQDVKAPSLRIDIPKDGLPPTQVPNPDAKYVNAATEEYSRLTSSTIRDVITKSLANAGH